MEVVSSQSMVMHFDNQVVVYIANNHVFRERTKHIEVDCHFIRDMLWPSGLSRLMLLPELN